MSSDLGSLAPLRNTSHERECPRCERPLTVRDTRTHEVLTATGLRAVVEVTRRCPDHRRVVVPPRPLTPEKSPFAFDLVVEAGILRFLHHRQLQEIQEEFHRRGLPRLPLRTIQRLTDRFALYHAAVHWESLPRLREALRRRGGYVLVLDGTGEAGSIDVYPAGSGTQGRGAGEGFGGSVHASCPSIFRSANSWGVRYPSDECGRSVL